VAFPLLFVQQDENTVSSKLTGAAERPVEHVSKESSRVASVLFVSDSVVETRINISFFDEKGRTNTVTDTTWGVRWFPRGW